MSAQRSRWRPPRPATRRGAAPAHQRRRRHLRAGLRGRVRVRHLDGRGASAGTTRCRGRRARCSSCTAPIRSSRTSDSSGLRCPTLFGVLWAAPLSDLAWHRLERRRAAAQHGLVRRRDRGVLLATARRLGLSNAARLGLCAPRSGEPHAVPLREQRDAGGRRGTVPDRSRVLPHAVLALRRARVGRRRRRRARPRGRLRLPGRAVRRRRVRGACRRRPLELEARVWAPRGRGRAVEGLGLLLLVPPVFVGLLWIGANAVIMGDPLDFMYGSTATGRSSAPPTPRAPSCT